MTTLSVTVSAMDSDWNPPAQLLRLLCDLTAIGLGLIALGLIAWWLW